VDKIKCVCPGRKVQCDCGQIQAVNDGAPYVLPPTHWLDSWGALRFSFAVLCVSLLVGGGIAGWVVLDKGDAVTAPRATPPEVASAPTPTERRPEEKAKEKGGEESAIESPPEPKSKKNEHEKTNENDEGKRKTHELVGWHASEIPEPRTYSKEELSKQLLRSVLWIIRIEGKKVFFGSGGVIHVGRRLIITNWHVVRNESSVLVVFPEPTPQGTPGEVITQKDYYLKHLKEK